MDAPSFLDPPSKKSGGGSPLQNAGGRDVDPRPSHLRSRTFSGRNCRLIGGDHAHTDELKGLPEDERHDATLVWDNHSMVGMPPKLTEWLSQFRLHPSTVAKLLIFMTSENVGMVEPLEFRVILKADITFMVTCLPPMKRPAFQACVDDILIGGPGMHVHPGGGEGGGAGGAVPVPRRRVAGAVRAIFAARAMAACGAMAAGAAACGAACGGGGGGAAAAAAAAAGGGGACGGGAGGCGGEETNGRIGGCNDSGDGGGCNDGDAPADAPADGGARFQGSSDGSGDSSEKRLISCHHRQQRSTFMPVEGNGADDGGDSGGDGGEGGRGEELVLSGGPSPLSAKHHPHSHHHKLLVFRGSHSHSHHHPDQQQQRQPPASPRLTQPHPYGPRGMVGLLQRGQDKKNKKASAQVGNGDGNDASDDDVGGRNGGEEEQWCRRYYREAARRYCYVKKMVPAASSPNRGNSGGSSSQAWENALSENALLEREMRIAIKLWEEASVRGLHGRSDKALGVLYHFGRGVKQDLERARRCYERAVRRGGPHAGSAATALATMMAAGVANFKQDEGNVEEAYEAAAKHGSSRALYNLANQRRMKTVQRVGLENLRRLGGGTEQGKQRHLHPEPHRPPVSAEMERIADLYSKAVKLTRHASSAFNLAHMHQLGMLVGTKHGAATTKSSGSGGSNAITTLVIPPSTPPNGKHEKEGGTGGGGVGSGDQRGCKSEEDGHMAAATTTRGATTGRALKADTRACGGGEQGGGGVGCDRKNDHCGSGSDSKLAKLGQQQAVSGVRRGSFFGSGPDLESIVDHAPSEPKALQTVELEGQGGFAERPVPGSLLLKQGQGQIQLQLHHEEFLERAGDKEGGRIKHAVENVGNRFEKEADTEKKTKTPPLSSWPATKKDKHTSSRHIAHHHSKSSELFQIAAASLASSSVKGMKKGRPGRGGGGGGGGGVGSNVMSLNAKADAGPTAGLMAAAAARKAAARLVQEPSPSLIGRRVVIARVRAKPEWNGESGVAVAFDSERARYVVKIESGAILRMKRENLEKEPANYNLEGLYGRKPPTSTALFDTAPSVLKERIVTQSNSSELSLAC